MWFFHEYLAIRRDSRENSLLEESHVFTVGFEVVIIQKELLSLMVIDGTGHDKQLALLNVISDLVSACSKHLCLDKSLSKDLEDTLHAMQLDIVLSLGSIRS